MKLKSLFAVCSLFLIVSGCSQSHLDPSSESYQHSFARSKNDSANLIGVHNLSQKNKYADKILEEEYFLSKQEADVSGKNFKEARWHFANRAQNLRSYVDSSGWEINPRDLSSGDWYWKYRLLGLSREDGNFIRINRKNADINAKNEKISMDFKINRDSKITEWYTNTNAGTEQGFEISNPLNNLGHGNLVLKAEIETNLDISSVSDDKISFSNGEKSVLQYAGLKVLDATGKLLNSKLSIENSGKSKILNIHVDDSQAQYPIIIDPIASSPSWDKEIESNASMYSIASAGDVNGDGFGDLIVGLPYYDNGQMDEGRVYVFYGSNSGLSQNPGWVNESNRADAQFGFSVASAGDVNHDGYSDIVVGAPENTYAQEGKARTTDGMAYVFHGSRHGPSATPDWIGTPGQSPAAFGNAVSSAGDINGDGFSDIIIAAPYFESYTGRVFVYNGSSSGISNEPSEILETLGGMQFGYSISTAGDVNKDGFSDIIVGQIISSWNPIITSSVFVYHGSSTGLNTSPAWSKVSEFDADSFGFSVSSAGDVNGDGFSDIIVGAPEYTKPNTPTQNRGHDGRVYVFHGSSNGVNTTATSILESADQPGSWFGWSVASAGDMNGDGFSDVVIGAPIELNNAGRAYVYYGTDLKLRGLPEWTGSSSAQSTYFGRVVTGAGDVNGDGLSDIAIGNHKKSKTSDDWNLYISEYNGISTQAPQPSISQSPSPVVSSTPTPSPSASVTPIVDSTPVQISPTPAPQVAEFSGTFRSLKKVRRQTKVTEGVLISKQLGQIIFTGKNNVSSNMLLDIKVSVDGISCGLPGPKVAINSVRQGIIQGNVPSSSKNLALNFDLFSNGNYLSSISGQMSNGSRRQAKALKPKEVAKICNVLNSFK